MKSTIEQIEEARAAVLEHRSATNHAQRHLRHLIMGDRVKLQRYTTDTMRKLCNQGFPISKLFDFGVRVILHGGNIQEVLHIVEERAHMLRGF